MTSSDSDSDSNSDCDCDCNATNSDGDATQPLDGPTPTPTPAPSFATDIRPLFRNFDRTSMLERFDLWSYDDVRAHAEAIDQQVSAQRMPCDAPWNATKIALFQSWRSGGCLP